MRGDGWIQTRSGGRIWLMDPLPSDIDVADIACGLAKQCRFAGQCRGFMSVAQHSVIVADALQADGARPELALAGLLHDAAEAYLGDMVSPFKKAMPEYRLAEARMLEAIAVALDVDVNLMRGEEVRRADVRALATERRDLVQDVGYDWGLGSVETFNAKVEPWSWEKAEDEWIGRYQWLDKLRQEPKGKDLENGND